PECFGFACSDYARVLFSIRTRGCGCASARHSLRPLFPWATPTMLHPGENAPRECGPLHCKERDGAARCQTSGAAAMRPRIRIDGREAMDLKGAVALVTGGNGGLGQRICHALAEEGVHLAVMYARSREQAEGVAGELKSRYQINSRAFACDITDDATVDRLVGE